MRPRKIRSGFVAGIVVVVVAVILSGCATRTIYVQNPLPELAPIPEEPELVEIPFPETMHPDTFEAVQKNMFLLMDYADELRMLIEDYNEFAKEKND